MHHKRIYLPLFVLVFLCSTLIPGGKIILAQDEQPGSPLADQTWVRLGGPRLPVAGYL